MKAKIKNYSCNYGDVRTVTRFLLFPKVLDGEIRWMERAAWIEQYSATTLDDGWVAISWVK